MNSNALPIGIWIGLTLLTLIAGFVVPNENASRLLLAIVAAQGICMTVIFSVAGFLVVVGL